MRVSVVGIRFHSKDFQKYHIAIAKGEDTRVGIYCVLIAHWIATCRAYIYGGRFKMKEAVDLLRVLHPSFLSPPPFYDNGNCHSDFVLGLHFWLKIS